MLIRALKQLDSGRVPTVPTRVALQARAGAAGPGGDGAEEDAGGGWEDAGAASEASGLRQATTLMLSELVGNGSEESKGVLLYGPLLAWGWVRGLRFHVKRGWAEPDIGVSDWVGVAEDLIEGALAVVRRLPNFVLLADLELPTVPTDAFNHLDIAKPMGELNWDVIQAAPPTADRSRRAPLLVGVLQAPRSAAQGELQEVGAAPLAAFRRLRPVHDGPGDHALPSARRRAGLTRLPLPCPAWAAPPWPLPLPSGPA